MTGRAGRRQAVKTLLRPSSLAIIGASHDPRRMSGTIVHQIRGFGFDGPVYPVNPRHAEIAGIPCHADVLELADTPPDVAVIYLRAELAVKAAEKCASIGTKGLIVLSAGFAELGQQGMQLQDDLVRICNSSGMSMCGPNTIGLASFNAGFVAVGSAGFVGLDRLDAGGVAIISASGGLGATLYFYCRERHLGVSHLIGVGNEAVTTTADYLDAVIDDPDVTCVIALMESVRDPEGFLGAADRAVSSGKPVIVMKQGRSRIGRRAIQTHTAALGGDTKAFEATCAAHGVVVVRDLHDLVETAMLFGRVSTASSHRLGVLSLPGGGTSLLADTAEDHGLELAELSVTTKERLRGILPGIAVPANPLDPTAGFGRQTDKLAETIQVLCDDDQVETLVFFASAVEPDFSDGVARTLAETSRWMGAPLIVIWETVPEVAGKAITVLHRAGIPVFSSVRAGFAALRAHRRYLRYLSRLADADFGPLAAAGTDLIAALDAGEEWTAESVVAAAGVPRPAGRVVSSRDEAVAAVTDIGGTAVLKLHRPSVAHKTELGGVRIGVEADTAGSDYDTLVAAVESHLGAGSVTEVLVEEMIIGGAEVLVGVEVDEQFGPMITLGFGGVTAELIADVSHRMAPVNRQDVEEMLAELRCRPLLQGYRGAEPLDERALVDAVLRVSWLVHATRDRGLEIELNPLIVRPRGEGVVAADCVVTFHVLPSDGRASAG